MFIKLPNTGFKDEFIYILPSKVVMLKGTGRGNTLICMESGFSYLTSEPVEIVKQLIIDAL